jgi:hypothetical protein
MKLLFPRTHFLASTDVEAKRAELLHYFKEPLSVLFVIRESRRKHQHSLSEVAV